MDWFDSREDMAEHIAKKDEHVNPAMTSATALRIEIEHALERRFPAALTPAPRTIREVASTGIPQVDTLLDGGFSVGAISEVSGPSSSGRTSLVLGPIPVNTMERRFDLCRGRIAPLARSTVAGSMLSFRSFEISPAVP